MICPSPKCKVKERGNSSLKIRVLWGFKIYTCLSCMYIRFQIGNNKRKKLNKL